MGITRIIVISLLMVTLAILYRTREDTFNPDDIIGKSVLVTGASSGIGRETALLFCEYGANVMVTARKEHLLKEVLDECNRVGRPEAHHGYVVADMADEKSINTIIPETIHVFGRLDYLIMSHAQTDGYQFGLLADKLKNVHLIRRYFDISFFSCLHVTSDAMPFLIQSQGRVGIVSAMVGRYPLVNFGLISSTKHTLDGFYQTLDLESHFRGTNVTFTSLLLGAIDVGAVRVLAKRFEEEGIDLGKASMLWNPAIPAREAAEAIVRVTSLRLVEAYIPNSWVLWSPALLRNFFPNMFRDAATDLRS